MTELDEKIPRLRNYETQTVEEGISDGSLPATLNPRGTATTLYQLWLGASLRGKITRDREPMESALEATKVLLGQT